MQMTSKIKFMWVLMIGPVYLLFLIYHYAFWADLQQLIQVEFLPTEQTGSIFFSCYELVWSSSLDC